jgi:hypothetical protein
LAALSFWPAFQATIPTVQLPLRTEDGGSGSRLAGGETVADVGMVTVAAGRTGPLSSHPATSAESFVERSRRALPGTAKSRRRAW